MTRSTMTMRWLTAPVLAVGVLAGTLGCLAVGPASAQPATAAAASGPAPSGAVHVSVTRVRATSPAEGGAAPDVDPQLEKLQVPRLRLGYAKYVQDQVIEKTVAWGEMISIPVDPTKGNAAGRYEIVPVRAGAQPDRLVLRVKEIAPSAKEPCLELETEIQASRLNLWFCDATIEGGTMLFFVRAESVPR